MSIVTYTNTSLGFGVTYDDAETARAEGPSDRRFRAAWSDRISTRIAGGVLFCPSTATDAKIAGGTAPSLLITTDASPIPPVTLGRWDWDTATTREAGPFLTLTGADEIETSAVYWRGFPVLQLAAFAPPVRRPGMPVQLLGMLYTPQQTFASLMVVPRGFEDPWLHRFQLVMDGFFLLPIEREGRARTSHQQVRNQRLTRADVEDRAAR
jgi:hypothetical protein